MLGKKKKKKEEKKTKKKKKKQTGGNVASRHAGRHRERPPRVENLFRLDRKMLVVSVVA